MQLIDVLDERIIDLNAEAANKEEVLTLLAGKLKDAGYIADVEAFKKDIYLREGEGTTGIGKDVYKRQVLFCSTSVVTVHRKSLWRLTEMKALINLTVSECRR